MTLRRAGPLNWGVRRREDQPIRHVVPDVPPDAVRGHCRRFTLGDAMVLIAAGAVGLASTRFAIVFMWRDLASIRVPALDTWAGWRRFLFGPNQLALNATRFGNVILLNFLTWLILAAIIIRLRRPRPPLGELLRQPGFVACVTPVLTFVGCLVLSLSPLPQAVYAAVLVSAAPLSWMVLIATRQWRPEPGWIDCLGRVAGVTLMASSFAHLVLVSLPI